MHLLSILSLSVAAVTPGLSHDLLEAVHRDLNGTYVIVNVANGRRLASDAKVLFATKYGSIHDNQRWRFQPAGTDSFAIVNAITGLRILAQSSADWDQGFFAVSEGPIYQDQRWKLDLQEHDGSYLIVNVRSGRRILARSGEDGGVGFAAVAGHWPISQDQTWWLINQDMDEASRWMLRLHNKCKEGAVGMANRTTRVMSQLQNSEKAAWKLAEDVTSKKGEISNLKQRVLVEQKVNLKLAEQVAGLQKKTQGVLLELQSEQTARWKLADEVVVQSDELNNLRSQFRLELERTTSISSCLPLLLTWEGLRVHISKLIMLVAVLIGLAAMRSCRCRLKGFLPGIDSQSLLQSPTAEVECSFPLHDPCNMVAHGGELGFDFAYQIFKAGVDQSRMCLIKIQCPGVQHEDVEIQLQFNGVEVIIHRKASCGVEEMLWKKEFVFEPCEGLYEFKEDQMRLECGFLHLYFKEYTFQRRVIRFPQHFTLDATDNDLCWEYSSEATPGEALKLTSTNPGHLHLVSWFSSGDGTESTASTTPRNVV